MNEAEEWRPVAGFPDYEVSSLGRVMSRKFGKRRILRPGRGNRDGYWIVVLCQDGYNTRRVHSLVAEAFHGPRPEGLEVRHLNGDKNDNSAANLVFGTRLENMRDLRLHGGHPGWDKTHCKRGHEFTEANTLRSKKTGHRSCRACNRLRARTYYERDMFAAANVTLRESA